jgi:serine/threonine-protein kinase
MSDTSTTTDHLIGALVGRRYRLTERVARGGMGTVYRATDEILGRQVALKVMHPSLADDEGFVERFRREATNAARLNHANIVTVHDWGRDDSVVYMVMELVEGSSLRGLMDSLPCLPLDLVRHVVSEIAAGLDHAHANGVVHRDVKPENVLLTSGGALPRVKIVDFGIARALAETTRLSAGSVVGTMAYVSPEQLHGHEGDSRSDVHALGVMVYEMLAGRVPFEGDTPGAVAAARLTRSVPPLGVAPAVDGAVARATASRRQDRYETAGDFASALGGVRSPDAPSGTGPRAWGGPSPAGALRTTESTRLETQVLPEAVARRRRRRRRAWALIGAGIALAAGGGVALLLTRSATVPNLAGLTPAGARSVLARSGLRPGSGIEVFDDAAAGSIVKTVPAAGAHPRQGSRVRLVVSKGPDLLTVPHVIGKTLDDATGAIVQAGFAAGAVTEAFTNQAAKGTIAQQTPADGMLKRGEPIALVVSKGPELVSVPDLSGKTFEDAKQALSQSGLGASRSDDWSEAVAEGRVIKTSPSAGERAPKGSSVGVLVSKGPRSFPMPSLVGSDIADARSRIRTLGLVVGNEYAVPGSGKPKGQVQGQNPAAGTDVRKGARVDLYYSV